MGKLINFIFSKTPLFKVIDGKKTTIGAILVVMASCLQALERLAVLFPEHAWIAEAAKSTGEALDGLAQVLDSVGLGFLAAGVVHKGVKAKQSS